MRRSRKRKIPRYRWLIILVICAFPLFYFSKRVYTYVHLRREEKRLEKEILIRQAENEVPRDRINEYRRGTVLEAKARDDLGMVREGEESRLVGVPHFSLSKNRPGSTAVPGLFFVHR